MTTKAQYVPMCNTPLELLEWIKGVIQREEEDGRTISELMMRVGSPTSAYILALIVLAEQDTREAWLFTTRSFDVAERQRVIGNFNRAIVMLQAGPHHVKG